MSYLLFAHHPFHQVKLSANYCLENWPFTIITFADSEKDSDTQPKHKLVELNVVFLFEHGT